MPQNKIPHFESPMLWIVSAYNFRKIKIKYITGPNKSDTRKNTVL